MKVDIIEGYFDNDNATDEEAAEWEARFDKLDPSPSVEVWLASIKNNVKHEVCLFNKTGKNLGVVYEDVDLERCKLYIREQLEICGDCDLRIDPDGIDIFDHIYPEKEQTQLDKDIEELFGYKPVPRKI